MKRKVNEAIEKIGKDTISVNQFDVIPEVKPEDINLQAVAPVSYVAAVEQSKREKDKFIKMIDNKTKSAQGLDNKDEDRFKHMNKSTGKSNLKIDQPGLKKMHLDESLFETASNDWLDTLDVSQELKDQINAEAKTESDIKDRLYNLASQYNIDIVNYNSIDDFNILGTVKNNSDFTNAFVKEFGEMNTKKEKTLTESYYHSPTIVGKYKGVDFEIDTAQGYYDTGYSDLYINGKEYHIEKTYYPTPSSEWIAMAAAYRMIDGKEVKIKGKFITVLGGRSYIDENSPTIVITDEIKKEAKKIELDYVESEKKKKTESLNEAAQDKYNGWDYNEISNLSSYDSLRAINNLIYELKNAVRGSYTGAKTAEELAEYIRGLASDLEEFADDIEELGDYNPEEDEENFDESLNESKKPLKEATIISDVRTFRPWNKAVPTYTKIQEVDKLDDLEKMLEEMYPDGIEAQTLNDLLAYDLDFLSSMMGIDFKEEEEVVEEE